MKHTLNAVMLSGFRSSSFINSNAFSPNIMIVFIADYYFLFADVFFNFGFLFVLAAFNNTSIIKNRLN